MSEILQLNAFTTPSPVPLSSIHLEYTPKHLFKYLIFVVIRI